MATVTSTVPPRIIRRSQLRSLPPISLSAVTSPPPAASPLPKPAPVSKVQVVEHPAAQHGLAVLRSRQTTSWNFRTTSNQLLLLLAVEATRSLPLRELQIETGKEPWTGRMLAKPVVFLSVTRDGLGLSHTVADCLPGLLVGGISLERTHDGRSLQPRLHLASAPALSDSRVILFDPVVSSGASAGLALGLVRGLGATDISLISFIVSSPGLCRLQSDYPQLTVWTAGIDSDWDGKHGTTAVLGDFGERLFR